MSEFEKTRRLLLSSTGFDIGGYNPEQMNRILTAIMTRAGVQKIENYVVLLRRNPQLIQEFKNMITINVSDFFRDSKQFGFLDKTIFPVIREATDNLQIWSAGCASGEEPYSLAMLLQESSTPFLKYRIYGTDIDEAALENAGLGNYTEKSLKNVPAILLQKYFTKIDGLYRINPSLRQSIRFERHDLLTPYKSAAFNLILCRNVVIYFSQKYKEKIHRNIVDALVPGGVLFIGSTETLLNYREFGLEEIETYFYRKPLVHRNE